MVAKRAKMLNSGMFLWNAHQFDQGLRSRIEQKKLPKQEGQDPAGSTDETTEPDRELYWSELMSEAGYETFFTGKWHVSVAPETIFDHVRHPRGGMLRQTVAGYNRPVDGKVDLWSPSDPTHGGFWQGGKCSSDDCRRRF